MAKDNAGYVLNKFDDDDLPPSAPAIQRSVISNESKADGNDNLPTTKETSEESNKPTGQLNEDGFFENIKGISWPMCALYVVGDMAGGGIVSLPNAVKNTYFYGGIIMCLIVCAVSTFTCVWMGRCWSMLQQRWPEYRKHCRLVYAEMGNRAMGKWAKRVVLITIDVNQFGVCVIYLLLSAKGIAEALQAFGVDNFKHGQCYLVLVLFVVLFIPVTCLKSPADFWPLIFGAMACSILSVIFIMIGSGLDAEHCFTPHFVAESNGVSILSGLGTMVFAFGGHSSFPTIQHDMKKPYEFTKSTYLAYFICIFVYMPMAIMSNIVYGPYIQSSVINSIQTKWVQQSVNLMIVFHCITAFVLVINPLSQQVEEGFKIPQSFGWKRVVIRGIVLTAITFVGLTLPNFGPLLDLVGSSATLLTVLIFPVLFYLYLVASGRMRDEELALSKKNNKLSSDTETTGIEYKIPTFRQMLKYNDKIWVIIGFAVMAFGVFICICSSLSAIYDIVYAKFEIPCYVKWFYNPCEGTPGYNGNLATPLYCCYGEYTNNTGSIFPYVGASRECIPPKPRTIFEFLPIKTKGDYCDPI